MLSIKMSSLIQRVGLLSRFISLGIQNWAACSQLGVHVRGFV
jgi:hypothetical protein